ncbi:MAG: hypothetical protein ACJ71P_17160 [Nitrososphaeraceae archaeon]
MFLLACIILHFFIPILYASYISTQA